MDRRADPLPDPSRRLRVQFQWPAPAPANLAENVFFGVWNPAHALDITVPKAPPGIEPHIATGDNWLLAGSTSPLHVDRRALISTSSDGRFTVAFRGYVVDPPTHSYSPPPSVLNYWTDSKRASHNGVFSVAIIDDTRRSITLMTDVFGMGPLYYRVWNSSLLFASNPRFLALDGDHPDYLAWRTLIQTGFIASDRSLDRDVKRVPAGFSITWNGTAFEQRAWFNFDRLPEGSRKVDAGALQDVEDSFQQAVSRCQDLGFDHVTLPLSSGHDSRRILASLLSRDVDFDALTVRFRQKEFRDLDATYAAAMAADFHFRHTVVEPGTPQQYAERDVARRNMLDNESYMHAWAISLMEALPRHPSLFFDGLLGDILGNPGFRMDNMYHSTKQDLDLITRECVTNFFDPYLANNAWPTAADVVSDIEAYLQPFMGRHNMAEFAFILLRQRRLTSAWSQQLTPAGHVIACPYLDFDYLSLLFEFKPSDKHATVFQQACLRKFWPQFYKYPGNRDIPADLPPGQPTLELNQDLTCLERLFDEIDATDAGHELNDLLTIKARTALMMAKFNRGIAARSRWFLQPVAELVSRQARRRPCWSTLNHSAVHRALKPQS
jgi:hypothetical protein